MYILVNSRQFFNFNVIVLVQTERLESEKVPVAQSSPTLCDPRDCSPPGFSVQETLQATILEWVAVPFSRGSSQPRDRA